MEYLNPGMPLKYPDLQFAFNFPSLSAETKTAIYFYFSFLFLVGLDVSYI